MIHSILMRFGWVSGVLFLLFLALLPFVLLAAYCHPSADDFWLTNMVIAKGPWQAQAEIRQNWSGRYTAMLFGSFNPLVYYSFTFYKVLPVVFLVLLVAGLYWLVAELNYYQLPRRQLLAIALLLLALYLYQMPTVAQTIYWMSGSLTYQSANILLLFLLAALIRFYRKVHKPGLYFLKLLITLLLFAAIGCNETTMAMVAFLIFSLVLFTFYQQQQLNYFMVRLMLVTIVACSLVILAPGNAVRALVYPQQHDLAYALTYALLVPLNNSLNWFANSPILFFTVLAMASAGVYLPSTSFTSRIHPVAGIAIWYGCLVSGYFVAYWSKHDHSPPRAQDVIYLVFLVGWFTNSLLFGLFMRRKLAGSLAMLPAYAQWFLLLAGFLMLFYNNQSKIRTAYSDLLSGKAARYNQEMNTRYANLKSSSCQVCPIKTAKNRPESLFFEEVPPDSSWENTYYARYFGKKLLLVSD